MQTSAFVCFYLAALSSSILTMRVVLTLHLGGFAVEGRWPKVPSPAYLSLSPRARVIVPQRATVLGFALWVTLRGWCSPPLARGKDLSHLHGILHLVDCFPTNSFAAPGEDDGNSNCVSLLYRCIRRALLFVRGC